MVNENIEPQPEMDDEQFTAGVIQEMNDLNQTDGITPVESIGEVAPTEEAPSVEAFPSADTSTVETPPVVQAEPLPSAVPIPGQVDQLAQLRLENERLQQVQTQASVDAEISRYQTELTTQGIPEDSAKYLAGQQRQNLQAMSAMQFQAQNALMEQQGKMNAAMHYSGIYGVTPQALMMYDSPQAMEAAARQQRQIDTLQTQVAESKKASVQSQVMDASRSSPNASPNENNLVDSALSKAAGDRTELESAALRRAAGF